MSADNGHPAPPFQIGSSEQTNQQLRELIEYARSVGKHKPFLRALGQIVKRLQTAPFEFGECRFRLREAKMHCHIGVIAPAAIQFAIHEESPSVIIVRVLLLNA